MGSVPFLSVPTMEVPVMVSLFLSPAPGSGADLMPKEMHKSFAASHLFAPPPRSHYSL